MISTGIGRDAPRTADVGVIFVAKTASLEFISKEIITDGGIRS